MTAPGLKLLPYFFLAHAFGVTLLSAAAPFVNTQLTGQASVTYTGTDGSIEYVWVTPPVDSVNALGTLHIKSHLNGVVESDIVLTPTFATPGTPLRFQGAQWTSGTDGPVWAFSFTSGLSTSQIYLQLSLSGKLLAVTCSASQPNVNVLDIGQWPFTSNPKPVSIPYYPGTPPVYLQTQGMFANLSYDWHSSHATTIDITGRVAIYSPLSNGGINTFSEKILVGVATNLPDLFPDIGNPPSPYLGELAGKTIIDVWAGAFEDVSTALRRLNSYGVNNCYIIVHNWQNAGYDNALPAHFPANSALGGDAELKDLVQASHALGCKLALHENYVDYYPNYSSFTQSAVMLTSNGALQSAYFNPATQVQSYATKPSWILTDASQQSPQIHSMYGTDSTFIDVNSSVVPWWRADMDATSNGAGQFVSFANTTKALWGFERDVYKGPVFGEGNNHAFWSGSLDGVEAQFGAGGVLTNIGSQAPLFVDFDLQRMHALQANHGMGYYTRWINPGDDYHRSEVQDAYRMQEVAFGHQPFIGEDFWQNPARILVEQNLVGPVAQRYGQQKVSNIQYQFKGNWTDVNTATKAGVWNRVQVKYENGDTVIANGSSQPMNWQGLTLPAFGWMATGINLLAYTAQRNGSIVDYSETATQIFANARNQSDLLLAPALAQPSVASFQTQGRTPTFNLQWRVLDYGPIDKYVSFVHFVSTTPGNQQIIFQCDHQPAINAARWVPGAKLPESYSCAIPASVPDGSYSMRTGLYSQSTGSRVVLSGVLDSDARLILGTINISGTTITFLPQQGAASFQPDSRLNSSGSVIDFDSVKTDGMVSLAKDATGWTVRSYPLYRNVLVQVKASRLSAPSPVAIVCDSPLSPVVVIPEVNGYWQIQMNGAKSCHW